MSDSHIKCKPVIKLYLVTFELDRMVYECLRSSIMRKRVLDPNIRRKILLSIVFKILSLLELDQFLLEFGMMILFFRYHLILF